MSEAMIEPLKVYIKNFGGPYQGKEAFKECHLKADVDVLREQLATVTQERDEHKDMLRKISEGQNLVHVLTQGMSMVIELQQQLATAQARILELEQALRLHLAVDPNDPILIIPKEAQL